MRRVGTASSLIEFEPPRDRRPSGLRALLISAGRVDDAEETLNDECRVVELDWLVGACRICCAVPIGGNHVLEDRAELRKLRFRNCKMNLPGIAEPVARRSKVHAIVRHEDEVIRRVEVERVPLDDGCGGLTEEDRHDARYC